MMHFDRILQALTQSRWHLAEKRLMFIGRCYFTAILIHHTLQPLVFLRLSSFVLKCKNESTKSFRAIFV